MRKTISNPYVKFIIGCIFLYMFVLFINDKIDKSKIPVSKIKLPIQEAWVEEGYVGPVSSMLGVGKYYIYCVVDADGKYYECFNKKLWLDICEKSNLEVYWIEQTD